MVDPFETLGIAPSFDVDLTSVEKRYRELQRVLHPDRHVGGSPADRRASLGKAVEVNEAWRLLRDPIRRAEALLRRHGVRIEEGKEPKPEPEFLMEMMEQREALSEARGSGDPAKVEQMASAVRKREQEVVALVAAAFAAVNGGAAASGTGTAVNGRGAAVNAAGAASGALDNVVPLIGELRYYRRFLDEVSAIEESFSEKGSAVSND
jgi:molecular chaperone HscB